MSYKRTLRGVDYLIENELDEKEPSAMPSGFKSIADDDIPW